jgi:hypothetical protein
MCSSRQEGASCSASSTTSRKSHRTVVNGSTTTTPRKREGLKEAFSQTNQALPIERELDWQNDQLPAAADHLSNVRRVRTFIWYQIHVFLTNKDYTLMHKTSGQHLLVSRVIPSMFVHNNQPMIWRPPTVCKAPLRNGLGGFHDTPMCLVRLLSRLLSRGCSVGNRYHTWHL